MDIQLSLQDIALEMGMKDLSILHLQARLRELQAQPNPIPTETVVHPNGLVTTPVGSPPND
jgi:hypothetical protein